MFGSKQQKQDRLDNLTENLLDGEWHTQSQLANDLNVPRSTIFKYLPDLEDRGVHLEEDDKNRVRLSNWWRRKR